MCLLLLLCPPVIGGPAIPVLPVVGPPLAVLILTPRRHLHVGLRLLRSLRLSRALILHLRRSLRLRLSRALALDLRRSLHLRLDRARVLCLRMRPPLVVTWAITLTVVDVFMFCLLVLP